MQSPIKLKLYHIEAWCKQEQRRPEHFLLGAVWCPRQKFIGGR